MRMAAARDRIKLIGTLVTLALGFGWPTNGGGQTGSITNLYDAFGKAVPGTHFAWGYSALIRFGDKTILFDAGGDANQFAQNVKALGIDLRSIDYAVLSHRHGDHASGFDYVFTVNPSLKLYAPDDLMLGGGAGLTLPAVPRDLVQILSPELRYFPGEEKPTSGPWGSRFWHANVEFTKANKQIAPDVFLIATTSPLMGDFFRAHATDEPTVRGFPELSLALVTSKGVVVVSGCSHSGVEVIVAESKKATGKNINLVSGGFHLLPNSEADIQRLGRVLKEQLGVQRVAPAHCTGMLAFKVLRELYGREFVPAGLGTTVAFTP
jgi:7,8-dihydropterin-6-yl-methyl-4-(beta-D-ribofuranosyl)aminobenzene 5'-phosphate synthase